MSFLKDYLIFNDGNECPENYHIWGGLAVLSAIISRRVWVSMGYFNVVPNLYVCLVGEQGDRKTSAKDIAYDMMRESWPDMPVSSECISKEAITKYMAEEEQMRYFKDPATGKIVEYHPFAIFVTELKNFLAINPAGMVDFLTTIYDRKFYDSKTKNKGNDVIPNPCVVFLACETPEWLIARLKDSIISGGFCRRVIFVYEGDNGKRIPYPVITEEAAQAYLRCVAWLKGLADVAGEFKWEPEAKVWYSNWYKSIIPPEDPFMKGYSRSKHIQLIKVAMLIALSETKELILRLKHLQLAEEFLRRVEVNMPKLAQSVGRNELAYHANRLVEMLIAANGVMAEIEVKKIMYNNLGSIEFFQVVKHLTDTNQIAILEHTNKAGAKVRYLIVPALRAKVEEELKKRGGGQAPGGQETPPAQSS